MDWLWPELQREWAVVRQTPLLSCLVWALGLVAILFLVNKFYRSRIAARDDLLQMYQEKLGLGPHKRKPYSKLSNRELRDKAAELAQGIRAFTAMAGSQVNADPSNFAKFWPYVAGQFANNFKVQCILLRDEIITRLAGSARETYKKSDLKGAIAFVYQNPVNTGGMEMVADDLDKMAKMLPLN